MSSATARAHPNIALVKYWGKRDVALNLPAVGSISITLDSLHTTTNVHFDAQLEQDTVSLDGASDASAGQRVSSCLDLLREIAGRDDRAAVTSVNNFPTAAGLASSASGFAALVVAADAALDLGLPRHRLSELARRGSGSAARSLFGGFVEMELGEQADGSDSVAAPLLEATEWPLAVTVGVISRTAKSTGSTDGMELTRSSSPYYNQWVQSAPADLAVAREAIEQRDFEKLADVSEHSCLKMHALAMAAQPGLLYWHPATVAGIHMVRELRRNGHAVFFTIDAGPQLKVVSASDEVDTVTGALRELDGVIDVLHAGLGAGAAIID